MADQTVHAEALIQTVARAFYGDDVVCLIDVLIRDKYLRDDDMGQRLSLPARKLRMTMQFLQEEHLVKYELVNDLSTGGSQTTKYWYIDFNHAVSVVRYRIHLLRKRLDEDELRARSNSMYLCPGYAEKTCNGRYTETQAQRIVDPNTGHFLCPECYYNHVNNPDPPPADAYTLRLQDNASDLRQAQENIRRVRVQLQSKTVGKTVLRPGVYDLLQKVRACSTAQSVVAGAFAAAVGGVAGARFRPLPNNLPSDNIERNIGTKRIEGTGRTAGIKKKRDKLLEGARRTEEGDAADGNFLKNQKGEEISFEVEKGGGARANLLASRATKRTKLLDAAAGRLRTRREEDEDAAAAAAAADDKGRKKTEKPAKSTLPGLPFFLKRSIADHSNVDGNRDGDDGGGDGGGDGDDDTEDEDEEDRGPEVFDSSDAQKHLTAEQRRATFQALYKLELTRQKQLFLSQHSNGDLLRTAGAGANEDDEYDNVLWVDG